MQQRSTVGLAATFAALALAAAVTVIAGPGIASHWKDRPQAVDGATGDWPVLDGVGDDVSVAAVNDDRDLYLAIASSDPQRRRQLLLTGLVVWLDPAGGRKEAYGIRIPGAGFAAGPRGRMGRFGAAAPDDAADGPATDAPPPALTSIELLGPGKDDRRRLELSAVPELAAAVGLHEGTLLYELRLPLAAAGAGQPYGIGARLDRPLGLGIETPKPERPAQPAGADRGRAGGGRRGGFGGAGGLGGPGGGFGGGRGGTRGGRGGFAQVKPVKIWTSLTLARQQG